MDFFLFPDNNDSIETQWKFNLSENLNKEKLESGNKGIYKRGKYLLHLHKKVAEEFKIQCFSVLVFKS